MKPEFHSYFNNKYYSSNLNKVYENGVELIKIPSLFLRYNFSKIIARLLRQRIHNVDLVESSVIVVIKSTILVYSHIGNLKHKIKIERGSRPLRQGIASIQEQLYYGDYWQNPNKELVNLYQVNLKTGEKQVFKKFDDIRHIHFVIKDQYKADTLLIGTGDTDKECRIFELHLATKSINILGNGSQTWRAVSLLQLGSKLFWGSDSPDSPNYIYCFHRENSKLKRLLKINGPAYYSTQNSKGHFFIATTIENREIHEANIYCSKDGGVNWNIIKSFKKDFWSSKYFGYGLIEFIQGQENLSVLKYNLGGLKEII